MKRNYNRAVDNEKHDPFQSMYSQAFGPRQASMKEFTKYSGSERKATATRKDSAK
jgi:hypothetical protein